MRFTKMQGLGNDFVLIYGAVPEAAAPLCRRLCDRHFGVGADGVIFLSPSRVADCSMRIFNADGSEAMMCGNGIRCAGKYLYEKGIVPQKRMTVETRSGVKTLRLSVEGGRVESVLTEMGRAEVEQENVPLPDGVGAGMLISVGNPHLTVFVEDAEAVPLSVWGPRIERDPKFGGGVNVEFIEALCDGRLRMRVWERGCGVTLACGTGACAAVFAAVRRGVCRPGKPAEVVLDGGCLFVTADEDGNLLMEGPAVTVFEGEAAL